MSKQIDINAPLKVSMITVQGEYIGTRVESQYGDAQVKTIYLKLTRLIPGIPATICECNLWDDTIKSFEKLPIKQDSILKVRGKLFTVYEDLARDAIVAQLDVATITL